MSHPINERSVVVVGASSGIGRGMALRLVREGATVILAARRSDRLAEVVAEAGGGWAVPTDLRAEADCAALAAETAQRVPSIDLLFVAAGTAPIGRIETITSEDWDQVIQTNLIGIHRVITALLEQLAPEAVVAVVSSESVDTPKSHLGAYGASKAALEHTMLQWQEEHPGLRFTTIGLGATVPTEFGHGFAPTEIVDAIETWAANGRIQASFMDTAEVCDVLFQMLASTVASPTVGIPRVDLRSPSPRATDSQTAVEQAEASRDE